MKRWMAGLATGLLLTVVFGGAAEAQYGGGNPPFGSTPPEEAEVGGVTITAPVQNPPQVQGVERVARPQPEVLGVTQTRGLLVRTGQEAGPYALTGAALVAIGAIFVAGARRRGIVIPAA